MMAYRIVQWGTGVVGAAAARKVIEHSEFELVGCFAHGATKIGQDAGTLAGVAPIGVAATHNIEDIIALKPDCVLYMPLVWSIDDMARLLEAGINVISTANFITGRAFGKAEAARLDQAAKAGGVSLFGTGINPGMANALGLFASANCARLHKITVREAVDATLYASRETWESCGFGGPADAPGLAEKVRDRALVFVDAVEMMADALKIKIDDEIAFKADFATANEDLHLGYMDIAQGTVCGLRMSYSGQVNGVDVIVLQLVWRLGYAMTPDWPVEGYVVEIEGEPSIRATLHAKGDPTSGGLSTAMNAVHAIPAVCAARPGIVTAAELPMIVAAYCVEPAAF
jgi:hypothetical protein